MKDKETQFPSLLFSGLKVALFTSVAARSTWISTTSPSIMSFETHRFSLISYLTSRMTGEQAIVGALQSHALTCLLSSVNSVQQKLLNGKKHTRCANCPDSGHSKLECPRPPRSSTHSSQVFCSWVHIVDVLFQAGTTASPYASPICKTPGPISQSTASVKWLFLMTTHPLETLGSLIMVRHIIWYHVGIIFGLYSQSPEVFGPCKLLLDSRHGYVGLSLWHSEVCAWSVGARSVAWSFICTCISSQFFLYRFSCSTGCWETLHESRFPVASLRKVGYGRDNIRYGISP